MRRLVAGACIVVAAAGSLVVAYVVLTFDPARRLLPVAAIVTAVSAAAVLAALLALRRPLASQLTVLLAIGSALVGLYAVETTLAVSPALRLGLGEAFRAVDSRSKLQVIRDLRDDGRAVWSSFAPSLVVSSPADLAGAAGFLPLGSIPDSTAVSCNEAGRWLVYETDEHGFNNPRGIWGTGPVDILALGDSFTHGACVPPRDNMLGWLRRTHPRTLNLGAMGNGPLLQLAGLVEYGSLVQPRTVLWFFFEGNDLMDLRNELRNPLLGRYLEPGFSQGLPDQRPRIRAVLEPYLDEAFRVAEAANPSAGQKAIDAVMLRHLRHALRLDRVVSPTAAVPRDQAVMDSLGDLRRVLERARTVAGGWEGRVVFIYLPAWTTVVDERDRPNPQHEAVMAAVSSLGFPVVDAYAAFRSHPDPGRLFRYPGSHYNEAGYRLVAETIQKAGVLPAASVPAAR